MSTSEYKGSQDYVKEIKLQINQRLFDAGLISDEMYRLTQETIINEN